MNDRDFDANTRHHQPEELFDLITTNPWNAEVTDFLLKQIRGEETKLTALTKTLPEEQLLPTEVEAGGYSDFVAAMRTAKTLEQKYNLLSQKVSNLEFANEVQHPRV